MTTGVIECEHHGAGPAAFVCAHVSQALETATEVGFNWQFDADGDWTAVCDACHALCDEAGAIPEHLAADIIEAICFECFEIIAEMHGVDLQFDPQGSDTA